MQLESLMALAWEQLKSGSQGTELWAVSNKKAALISLIVRHGEPSLWNQLLPQLLQLAPQGPLQAVKAQLPSNLSLLASMIVLRSWSLITCELV